MSCLRANYVPFPISPRNSPSAVAHLVSKGRVSHLLIGHEPAMVELAKDALRILKEEYPPMVVAPDVTYLPLFQDLFLPVSESSGMTPEALPYEYHGPDVIACMMHSSGTLRISLLRCT